jgi:hypothetical protein
MSYYTYVHWAGYGSDDHLADEWIARAARLLGVASDADVAEHVGMAAHAVHSGRGTVRVTHEPGVRARMTRALKTARAEFEHRPDCLVSVELERVTTQVHASGPHLSGRTWRRVTITRERRDPSGWKAISSETLDEVR